jgi:hypothetical protein
MSACIWGMTVSSVCPAGFVERTFPSDCPPVRQLAAQRPAAVGDFDKVALREHHPRHDPHQHDHDGRNPRDNRPSPPAFFQLAQLALQIHPPSGERVR